MTLRYAAYGAAFAVLVLITVGVEVFLGPTVMTRMFLAEYLKADEGGKEAVTEKYMSILPGISLIDALEKRDPLCHTDAHPFGRVIFRQTGNLAEALPVCGSKCSYGCFHGVLMEMFSTKSDTLGGTLLGESDTKILGEILAMSEQLCSRKEVMDWVVPWACIHGFGHVLMYMSQYNPQEAVAACQAFDDPTKDSICAGGAFMEFMQNDAYKASVREKNYFPCDLFPSYARSCFIYKGRPMVEGWGSVAGAIEGCRALDSSAERLACIRGVGVTGGSLERLRKSDGLIGVCDSLTGDELAACIDGAVTYVVFRMEADSSKVCEEMAPEFEGICLQKFLEFEGFR